MLAELQSNAAEVVAKCNYVESTYVAGKVGGWPRLAKAQDFLITIQVFRSSKATWTAQRLEMIDGVRQSR